MIEIDILLKATALAACGLAAASCMGRARASTRHLCLAATFGALALLPVAALTVPSVEVVVPARYSAAALAPAAAVEAPSRPVVTEPIGGAPLVRGFALPSLRTAARWAWAGGSLLVFGSLLLSCFRVRTIRRDGVPRQELAAITGSLAAEAGVRRRIDVVEHEVLPAPLTCGLRHPAIVLPREARQWDPQDVRRALIHELEHVRRSDWAVQLAARAVCAGFWFHPLVWAAWRKLCLEAERACDDAVVNAADRADYANQLVLLASRLMGKPPRAVLGMANRSDLSSRVRSVLDERQRRGPVTALATALALAVVLAAVGAIAPVRAVGAAPPQQTATARVVIVEEGEGKDGPWTIERRPRRGSALDRALLEAAQDGDLTGIDQLLQAGANVNAAIEGDGSPLIVAARGGHLDAVRRLLDRGADPNLGVRGDGAPLIAAAREGRAEVVQLLIDRRADIELVVPGDENALIQASASGQLDIVKLLVARGANVNVRVWVDRENGREGVWRSPLSEARRERHAAVVDFLLGKGARE